MQTVVFSDIHGNLPALELLLKKESAADKYICLGDVVNYGPWSNECVELLMEIENITILLGNHEEDYLKGESSCDNILVNMFFSVTYPSFKHHDVIRKYLPEYAYHGYLFSHTINGASIYPDTPVDLTANRIIGHSHHQYHLESGGYHLYNPGSVGQNRKHINQICYMVIDDHCEVCLKSMLYNSNILISEMQARRYPEECIAYYAKKALLL